ESEDENKIGMSDIIMVGDPEKMFEASKYLKRIEGGTGTLDINSEQKKPMTVSDEMPE
ncbi:31658_t:CDS:2, partial [Gigaspora margarita]